MKYINIVLLLSALLLISCDPCQEVDCSNPFTDEELSWLPYDYSDKLIFLETNSKDSLTYRVIYKESGKREPKELGAPYCITSCFYQMSITGNRKFSNGEEDRFGFGMDNVLNKLKLTAGPNYEFNLDDAVHLDSIFVNNKYIKDVYQYICKPEQTKVAETYMHQGMGLVKIVFRDGQEFELVEHIKAK